MPPRWIDPRDTQEAGEAGTVVECFGGPWRVLGFAVMNEDGSTLGMLNLKSVGAYEYERPISIMGADALIVLDLPLLSNPRRAKHGDTGDAS